MNSHFYVFDGGHFVSSELTRGPWDPHAQHAGPPAALLARALERCPSPADPEAPWQIGRVTFEILRSVPIAPLTVSAEVVRPGRSVELLSASLADERGDGDARIVVVALADVAPGHDRFLARAG